MNFVETSIFSRQKRENTLLNCIRKFQRYFSWDETMFFCWNTLTDLQNTSGDCNIFVGLNRIAGKLLIFTGFICSLLHLSSNFKLVKIGHSRHYEYVYFRFGSWFLAFGMTKCFTSESWNWKMKIWSIQILSIFLKLISRQGFIKQISKH